MTIEAIQQATQKGRTLGDDRFKDDIGEVFQRHTRPLSKGGDRRSVEYQKQRLDSQRIQAILIIFFCDLFQILFIK